MNPWVLNGVAALVGLAGWGIGGGILAFVIAWSISMLIGQVSIWIDGGILPKSIRKQTAKSFLETHRETAIAAYPGLNDHALQKAIECEIEDICKTAAGRLEYDQVMAAAQQLEKEEVNPLRRYLITAIGRHLEHTWWPQGFTHLPKP